jgi:hypothetical protein
VPIRHKRSFCLSPIADKCSGGRLLCTFALLAAAEEGRPLGAARFAALLTEGLFGGAVVITVRHLSRFPYT